MVSGGYLRALLGWVIGGVVSGVVATAIAAVFVVGCEDPADAMFACLGVFLVALAAVVLSTFIGGAAGCYVALRRGRLPAAGATVAILVGLLVASGVLVALMDAATGFAGVFIPLVPAGLIGAPLLARHIALSLVRGPVSKSDGSSDIVGSPPL
jgi:hypothetical protein